MRYRVGRVECGLTLIECLLTLVLVTSLLVLAVPSYRDQLSSARSLSAARQLLAAIQFARSAALSRRATVSLCPQAIASSALMDCSGHFGQTISAVLASPSGEEVMRVWSPMPEVTVLNRQGTQRVTGPIRWHPNGLGSRNLTLSVCAGGQNWSVVVNRLGRPRLAKDWGHCPD